jgi:hypothetical protein
MTKQFLLILFLALAASPVSAQRYIDIKAGNMSPADGDTLETEVGFPLGAWMYNLGPDTLRMTDSIKYSIIWDGFPIIFGTPPDTASYITLGGFEIAPGDSTDFGFTFGVGTGWPVGPQDICLRFVPFNLTDSIADTVLGNNEVCANVVILDPTDVNDMRPAITMVAVYPNPATTTANFKLTLKRPASIDLEIADMAGRVVARERRIKASIGEHTIPVNTSSLSPGLYVYKLRAGGEVQTGKLQIR